MDHQSPNPVSTRQSGTLCAAPQHHPQRLKLPGLLDLIRQEALGHPVSLAKRLHEPGAHVAFDPHRSVALSDLIRWDLWFRAASEIGRTHADRAFRSYGALAQSHGDPRFSCTLREVMGFANSKSDLASYSDLDALALDTAANLVQDTSPARLDENLSWTGVSLRRVRTVDRGSFFRCLWDGRIFWLNDDGSHHFAAARYIAGQLGVDIELQARDLVTVSLHEANVQTMLNDWHLFAVDDFFHGEEVRYAITESLLGLFWEGEPMPPRGPSLFACLQAVKAPFFVVALPSGFNDRARAPVAIFLPRQSRTDRIASAFHNAGAFDLGDFFRTLCLQQRAKRT